jgi:carboxyl-terminal processing protease
MLVFEGSPAYKKGIRRGDILSRVAGEDAKGWTVDQAMHKLRGRRGPTSTSASSAAATSRLIPIQLTRDEVTIPTVPAYFMIDATTGYIRMQDFGENTDRDVKHALHDLAGKGMRRLLFDVRGNPGGPLDQAIKVANEFLPKGKMIVYTRGRVTNSDQDYRAQEESEFLDMPIVALANRNSASASEIVTGALQDHDRAYIVGETTFGKALVQSVYRISGNAGLALTTAHYFTPAGTVDSAALGRELRRVPELLAARPGLRQGHNASDLKRTDSGRPVYSGGGIEPDKRVAGPLEGFNPGRFGRMLYARGSFANYAQKYAAEGDTRISQQSTGRKSVKPNFVVDDAMVADFREQLEDRSREDRRGRLHQGHRFHQGDDPIRDRQRRVRHRRGAAPPDRRRSAGAGSHGDVRRGAEARRAQPRRADESAVSAPRHCDVELGHATPINGGAD